MLSRITTEYQTYHHYTTVSVLEIQSPGDKISEKALTVTTAIVRGGMGLLPIYSILCRM